MKRVSFGIILLALTLTHLKTNAQVFWTEDFQNNCSASCMASGYSGANGAWTITSTGTNGVDANVWYVSGAECGNAAGTCGSACGSTDPSLHVGSSGTVLGDNGASYLAGGLSIWFPETDKRAESPSIDCTGRTNITLSFNYIENGDGTNDNAELWYFDGTTWTMLIDLAKTPTTCAPQGTWTNYSQLLPASANNNPNIKIGFRWYNNDDNIGTDPSFAVDDITLSVASSNPPPVASFTPSATTICAGDSITFTDNSTGTNISAWNWTFNGGSPSSANTQGPHIVTFNTAGTYNITLQVTDANGTDDTTIAITVNPLPTVTANATPSTSICQGDQVTLTGSGASTYTWDNGVTDGVPFTPSSTTTYTVTGTDANGCSNTDQITITVNNCSQPLASFTPSATSICEGDSITFTDNSTGTNISAWNWTFNGGTPASANTQGPNTVTFNTAGTYNITLQITDANGTDDTTITITVNSCNLPTAQITASTTEICQGSCITFNDNASGGTTSWNWIFTGGTPSSSTQQNPGDVCWNTAGNFDVILIVSNSLGSDTDTVNITVHSLPTVTASGDTTIVLGGQADLTANGTPPGGTYNWTPNDDLDCNNCNSPVASPQENTTYTVLYTDSNGCFALDSVQVLVEVETAIGVPNAFSPNNDGNNDILYVKGNGVETLLFIVYNRYGQKVFETTDISQGWNGTFKGKPENEGVFVYYLEVTFKDFSSQKLKGNITLIR